MIRQQQQQTASYRVVTTGQGTSEKKTTVPATTGGKKLMRLRCRLRPLHDVCFSSDGIADKECDVTFFCDGGEVRAHKIILAMASKFFTQLFRDEKPHKPSFVSVPDVPVGTMRLILLLCYKDRVSVGMKTLKDLGNYLSLFGLTWDQFNFSETTVSDRTEQASSSRKSLPASNIGTTTTTTSSNTNNNNSNRITVLPRQSLQFQPVKSQVLIQPTNVQQTNYGAGTTNLKNSSQTFILDNTNDSTDSSEYNNRHLYQNEKPKLLPKPRLILPKPPGNNAQVIYRTVQTGPPVLQRMSTTTTSSSSQIQIVQQSQGPSIEMDVSADSEDAEPVDTPEAKKLMQEWMASLGKSAGSPPKLSRSTPVKRRASPPVGSPGRAVKAEKSARMQCSVCSNIFDDEAKWRWHEERHVGLSLFKCTICDQILPTARKVYQHEMMEHGIVASGSDETDGSNAVEKNSAKSQPRLIGHVAPGQFPEGKEKTTRVAVVKTQYGTHYRRLGPATSPLKSPMIIKKYKTAATAKLHQNFAHRNPKIGIGHAEGQELVESRKLKQLHWLYVCAKCETCSDSSSKATAHYRQCYPDQEKEFEDSVLKFRQGFYGKCKCPLCPRRYTSLGGFLIHCGHMHNTYRKKFSHINTEDKVMCVTCREKFAMPDLFHAHLNKDEVCDKQGKEDSDSGTGADAQHGQQDSSSTNQTFEESRQKQYAKLLGTNPRSARLQNRLAAVTACFEDDVVDEATLPPVACPICGTGEIKNLTMHLSEDHPEIDVKIERFEVSTLRCKACSITFATCDLLAHNNSCTGSKGLNYVAQRKAAGTIKPAHHEPPKPKEPFEYPEGIGCSPVDTMDYDDLMSVEVLQKQFQCPICKKVGKKMNVIADCMRNHGVYRCAVCFNTYMQKDNNSIHLKKCHGNNSGKLICPICNIVRANAGQLVSHMYSAHWQALLHSIKVGDTPASASTSKAAAEGEGGAEKTEVDKEEDTLSSSVEGSEIDSKADDSIQASSDDYSNLTLSELLKTSDPAPTEKSKTNVEAVEQEEGAAATKKPVAATKVVKATTENNEEVKTSTKDANDKAEPEAAQIEKKSSTEEDK